MYKDSYLNPLASKILLSYKPHNSINKTISYETLTISRHILHISNFVIYYNEDRLRRNKRKQVMKSKLFKTLIVLAVLAGSAIVALAGLTFVGGAGFGSGSVIIDARLVGISGNSVTTVTATITDGTNLIAVCRNKGGNTAYGQNPVNLVGITASQAVSPDSNGNADTHFHINIIQAAGIDARAAGCPNGNWTVTDLLGGIQVTIVAANASFSDSLSYSCFVSDVGHVVACTQN
jgi:hypothetical protein